MRVSVKIGEDEVLFTSAAARAMFFHRNKGKLAWLTIDDLPTTNIRRYFEGALVPAVFYQHYTKYADGNIGVWKDFKECREALKLEFLASYATSLDGERIRTSQSTANLTKRAFTAFVERISRWLEENEMEIPDPEEYKAWLNSAPPPGEIYPQLARLKDGRKGRPN